jgi:signal peptidase II
MNWRSRPRVAFAVVAVAVFVLDRITKNLITAKVASNTEFPVIDHLVWITNIHNSGAAFGMAPAAAILFLAASVAVSIGLVVYVARNQSDLATDSVLGMILGGTVGNGWDRLVSGTVTDFIAVHWWPVFNVADSAISIGVVLLAAGYVLRRPAHA